MCLSRPRTEQTAASTLSKHVAATFPILWKIFFVSVDIMEYVACSLEETAYPLHLRHSPMRRKPYMEAIASEPSYFDHKRRLRLRDHVSVLSKFKRRLARLFSIDSFSRFISLKGAATSETLVQSALVRCLTFNAEL